MIELRKKRTIEDSMEGGVESEQPVLYQVSTHLRQFTLTLPHRLTSLNIIMPHLTSHHNTINQNTSPYFNSPHANLSHLPNLSCPYLTYLTCLTCPVLISPISPDTSQVLQEKKATVGANTMMGSSHVYDINVSKHPLTHTQILSN